jgi:hypothetical protein
MANISSLSSTQHPHADCSCSESTTSLHVVNGREVVNSPQNVANHRPSYFAELTEDEELWRDRYTFLLDRGLQLRVRYEPGWTASWLGTNLSPTTCEDSIEKRVRF